MNRNLCLFCLIPMGRTLFCHIILLYYYPLEAYLFSNEIEMGWIQMGGDLGEGLGGVEGWKP